MIKKLVSFLLSVSLCMISTQALAFSDVENNADIDFVTGIGIMSGESDGTFLPEGKISRGEMAKIISDIYEYDSEDAPVQFDFFGNEIETLLTPESSEGIAEKYSDITPNHQYYSEIMLVTAYGVMIGTSDTTFEPERNLTVKEAIKVFVDLLGYRPRANLNGGYPSGYMKVASDLGLTVTGEDNEAVTRAKLAHLFAVAMENVDLMMADYNGQKVVYKAEEGNNLLSKFLHIDKITGIIVENSVTSLTGENTIGDDRIKIEADGVSYVLDLDEKCKYADDLIGRRVDCYYRNDSSNDPGKVVYCRVNKKNSEIVVKIENIENSEEFDGKVLEYLDENDKIKKVNILDGAYYIVNGKAVTNIPADMFEYDNGYVTLISSGASRTYDVVVITAYENWVINTIDYKEGYIYNKNADKNDETDDEFLLVDDDINCRIIDENGEEIKLEDLKAGAAIDVSRSADNQVVRILVSYKTVTQYTINSIDKYDNIISNGIDKYKVSLSFENARAKQSYKISQQYTLYLNSFGDVVWIEAGTSTWRMGYVYSIKYLDDEDYTAAKILVTDKTFKLYRLAEKVRYSDSKGNPTIKKDSMALANELNFRDGVIRYKLNEEDLITDIEIALEKGMNNEAEDRLYTMAKASASDTGYVYSTQFNTFGCQVFVKNGVTKLLSIPTEATNFDKYFFLEKSSLTNSASYDFTAYGTNSRNPEAEFITISANSKTVLSDTTNPSVVTDIQTTIDENDQVVTEITVAAIDGTVSILYDTMENDCVHNALARTCDQSDIKPRDVYTVEKGDIIRYTKDSSGYLNYIEMIFDANGEYNNSVYFDTLPDVDTAYKHTKKGVLAGTVGYYSKTISNTNPLGISSVKPVTSNLAKDFTGGAPRMFLGYVYDVYNGYMTYTNKDLYAGKTGMNESRYITETRGINDLGPLGVVEYDGKNVIVRRGTASDVRSYRDYPNNFSRVLVITASTDRRSCFIINGSVK